MRPTCTVDGCDNPCEHQNRLKSETKFRKVCRDCRYNKRLGDTRYKAKNYEGLNFVVQAVLNATDECVIWPFGKFTSGYGAVDVGDKPFRAHALTLHLTVGPAPVDKPFALHNCQNKDCINPRHTYWGDGCDNAADIAIGWFKHQEDWQNANV